MHLKNADGAWLPRLAARVWLEAAGQHRFAAVFGDRVVLIPAPGSSPAQGAGRVAERLAWCLKELGLAAEVWPVLRRRYAVRKSAFAPAGERPSVREHYASFAVDARYGLAAKAGGCRMRLTLVDDVITRGRTLLAAAARVREVFPEAELRAFALLRTLESNEMLRQVLDPCEGEVRWDFGDARRRP
jgi:hypothetical protein